MHVFFGGVPWHSFLGPQVLFGQQSDLSRGIIAISILFVSFQTVCYTKKGTHVNKYRISKWAEFQVWKFLHPKG